MTIQVSCPKGHKLKLDDKLAGKKVRCPKCQAFVAVPDAEEDEDDRPRRRAREDEDDEEDEDDPPRRRGREDDDEEDEDDEDDPPRRREREDDDDDDEDDDRPRKKNKKPQAKADDYDDEIREGEEKLTPEQRQKLRRKERKAQFSMVALGLQLHFVKFMILIVAICLGMLSFVLSLAILGGIQLRPDQNAADFAFLMGLSVPVFILVAAQFAAVVVAPVVGIIGSFFCTFTPKGARAKVIVISSLVFDILPIIAGIVRLLFNQVWYDIDSGKLARLNDYLSFGSLASMILGWLFFMVYLRDLGAYVGMPGVGNEALNLIAFLVVQVMVAPINFAIDIFAFGMLASAVGDAFGVIVITLLLLGWGAFLYFFLLLGMINLLTRIRAGVLKKA